MRIDSLHVLAQICYGDIIEPTADQTQNLLHSRSSNLLQCTEKKIIPSVSRFWQTFNIYGPSQFVTQISTRSYVYLKSTKTSKYSSKVKATCLMQQSQKQTVRKFHCTKIWIWEQVRCPGFECITMIIWQVSYIITIFIFLYLGATNQVDQNPLTHLLPFYS